MFLNSLSDTVDTSAPYPPWHGGGTLEEALARYGDSISDRAKEIVRRDYADYAEARNKRAAGIVTTKGGMEVHLDEIADVSPLSEFSLGGPEPKPATSSPPHPVDDAGDFEIPPGEPQAPRLGGQYATDSGAVLQGGWGGNLYGGTGPSGESQAGRELAVQNGFTFGYINGEPGNWTLEQYGAAGVVIPTDAESARLYAAYAAGSTPPASGTTLPIFSTPGEASTPGGGGSPTPYAPTTETGILPLVRYGLLALTAWSLLK